MFCPDKTENLPTKILFVAHSASWGGAENCLYLLLKGLDPKKFKPVVALPARGPFQNKLEDLKVPYEIIPMRLFLKRRKSFEKFDSKIIIQNVNALVQLILRECIQIVMTNTGLIVQGAFAAARCGIPHLWHIHELFSRNPWLNPLVELPTLYKLMDDFSVKVVSNSKCVKFDLMQTVKEEKIQVIHNGVEVPALGQYYSDKQNNFNFPEDVPVVCFAGTLSSWKGVTKLVEVARLVVKKISDVKFVIVGPTGDQEAALKKKIREYGMEYIFRFLGYHSHILPILASSDIFILPSIVDTFPLVVLEAMSLGKPIVATSSGGPEEMIVEGETGLLVPIDDEIRMANAVISLFENFSKIKSMGENAKKRVLALFSHKQYVEKFESLFEEVTFSRSSLRLSQSDLKSLLESLEKTPPCHRAKVAIVVPFHKMKLTPDEMISIRQLEAVLPSHEKYLVIPDNLDLAWPGFKIKKFSQRHFLNRRAYSQFLLTKEFYEAFLEFEYVLIYQVDSLVFSDRLLEWCDKRFDFIGAPWIRGAGVTWVPNDAVGNGGFSLRNIRSCLQVLQSYEKDCYHLKVCLRTLSRFCLRLVSSKFFFHNEKLTHFLTNLLNLIQNFSKLKIDYEHEDCFWSFEAKKYFSDFRIPSVDVALSFAFEVNPRHCFERNNCALPFGCHAWSKYDRSFWEPYLVEEAAF